MLSIFYTSFSIKRVAPLILSSIAILFCTVCKDIHRICKYPLSRISLIFSRSVLSLKSLIIIAHQDISAFCFFNQIIKSDGGFFFLLYSDFSSSPYARIPVIPLRVG